MTAPGSIAAISSSIEAAFAGAFSLTLSAAGSGAGCAVEAPQPVSSESASRKMSAK